MPYLSKESIKIQYGRFVKEFLNRNPALKSHAQQCKHKIKGGCNICCTAKDVMKKNFVKALQAALVKQAALQLIALGSNHIKLRHKRCLSCIECSKPDCGLCIECLDKVKFGGKNTRKR